MTRKNVSHHHSTPKRRGMPSLTRMAIAVVTFSIGIFVMFIAVIGWPADYTITAYDPMIKGNFKTTITGIKKISSEEKKMTSKPRIHFLTVQTSPTHGWCRMIFTFFLTQKMWNKEHRGVGHNAAGGSNKLYHLYHNIGWGETYGHQKRPGWVLKWIEARQRKSFDTADDDNDGLIKDHDILVFNDGGDTIFSGGGGGLEEGFLNTFVSHTALSKEALLREQENGEASLPGAYTLPALLFNAEANCYHQQTFDGVWAVKKGKCLSAYYRYYANIHRQMKDPHFSLFGDSNKRPILSKYRYLNGGAWIARVWAAKEVLSIAKEKIAKNQKLWCDQSVLGGILLYDGVNPLILGLDTQNRYFLPMYHVNEKTEFCPLKENEGMGLLRMCHSGQSPLLIHFNGKNAKVASDIIHRTPWWQHYRNGSHMSLVNEFLDNYSTIVGTQKEKHVSDMRGLCSGKVRFPE